MRQTEVSDETKKQFDKTFVILCHNCNFSKGHYGFCPHKKG